MIKQVCHYWDSNGALKSGHVVRMIKKGRRKGALVVEDARGKKTVVDKIRNVE